MSLQFYKPNPKGTGTACSFWRNPKDNTFWVSLIKQDGWNAKTRTGSFSKNKDNPQKRVIVKLNDTELCGFIDAINRKIKKYPGPKSYITEDYIQETADVYKSKAKTKKEYKADK